MGAGASIAKDLALTHGTRLLTDENFRGNVAARAGSMLSAAAKLRGSFRRTPESTEPAAAEPVVDPLAEVLEAMATLPTRDELAAALLKVRADLDRKLRLAIYLGGAAFLTNIVMAAILLLR